MKHLPTRFFLRIVILREIHNAIDSTAVESYANLMGQRTSPQHGLNVGSEVLFFKLTILLGGSETNLIILHILIGGEFGQ